MGNFKMKNPALAYATQAAGNPNKYASPLRSDKKDNENTENSVEDNFKKAQNSDENSDEGLTKRQIRLADKEAKKRKKLEIKAAKEELKRFGGDQAKLDNYNEKKALREANRETYKTKQAEKLALKGKSYNVTDNSGDVQPSNYMSETDKVKRLQAGESVTQPGAQDRGAMNSADDFNRLSDEDKKAAEAAEIAKLQEIKKSGNKPGPALTSKKMKFGRKNK
tara:strand:+ start:359 stop:1024 length:666 start_codon:yes stop_codon:yes gene_type:complete